MPLFKCSKCEYETKDKSNANKHIKNKLSCFGATIINQCEQQNDSQSDSQEDNTDLLVTIKNLENQLKIVMKILDQQNKQIQMQTDQIAKLTDLLIKKSKEPEEIQTQVQTQSQTTPNILSVHQTFKRVDEGLDFGREIMMSALKQKGNPVVNLIKEIHFNPKYPEFMNVVIRNKRLPDCLVFNKVWTTEKKENIINELISNYELSVESFISYDEDSDDEGYDDSEVDPFLKSCKEKLRILKKNAGDAYDKELYSQIHDVLYDNRDIIPR